MKTVNIKSRHQLSKFIQIECFIRAENFIIYTEIGQKMSCRLIAVFKIKEPSFLSLLVIFSSFIHYFKINNMPKVGI